MSAAPPVKRVVAFMDGQSLSHGAREAVGYSFLNLDPVKLAECLAGASLGTSERRLRDSLQRAGACRDPGLRSWRVTHEKALGLGLAKRIVSFGQAEEVTTPRNF